MKTKGVLMFGFAVAVFSLVLLPGDKTFAACNSATLSKVVFGNSGQAVQNLQNCLIEAGYTIPAGPTGYYGPQTRSAAQSFYADHFGLYDWDGYSVGPQGREKLGTLVSSGVINNQNNGTATTIKSGYKRAGDEKTLQAYINEKTTTDQFGNSLNIALPAMAADDSERDVEESSAQASDGSASRVSETNVQIVGIDEPDIVKTDGENIFFSQRDWYGIRPMIEPMAVDVDEPDMILPRKYEDQSATKVIDAFPPEDLGVLSKIEESGELLLDKAEETLIVLSYSDIVGYDVSDPDDPKKVWTLSLEDNTSMVTARMTDGKVYLVTQTWLDRTRPCPVMPITRGSARISIPCADIYVPMQIEPVSHTYSILEIDPSTGAVNNKLAFASDGGATTVSVSKNNVYLASRSYSAPLDVMLDIIISSAKPYIGIAEQVRIKTIMGYDISLSGKMNEINQIIQNDFIRKTASERLRLETEFNNAVEQQIEKRKRELDQTRIVRVPLDTLTIAATGEVPGNLLNQFSIDEHNGDVRISTTIGQTWMPWGGRGEMVNDIYVLGSDLKQKGSILDLGKGERIFATRFMGDKGYLVTFRQIDPFFVLDLSEPTSPKMVGELKIPGFSSYLEELSSDLVLGVGREDNSVKISLFDVSDVTSPEEQDKYLIKDEWSEVQNNHRAFMHDKANKTFFLPGNKGGYFFSYENDELSLKATVADYAVKRAIYLDDYYYVIGENEITVLDLNTWEEVKELEL